MSGERMVVSPDAAPGTVSSLSIPVLSRLNTLASWLVAAALISASSIPLPSSLCLSTAASYKDLVIEPLGHLDNPEQSSHLRVLGLHLCHLLLPYMDGDIFIGSRD